ILDFSPYRAIRARYEEVSSVELIPAVRDRDPIPERYRRVKEEIETTLLGADAGGAVATERSALEDLRARYEAALAAWEEGGGRTDEAGRELDERRSEYERGLSVMELALLVKGNAGNGAGNGELEELRAEYRAAEDDYVEAERLHEEKRGPYEEALRAAERRYEAERAKYVAAVEDIRKHLLEYDDVLNKQREVIYTRRRDLLSRDELKDDVLELAEGIAEDLIATHADADTASEEWDWKAIDDAVFAQFNFRLNLPEEERAGLRIGALQDLLVERIRKAYDQRETTFSA